jgi:hypothetical protein
MPIGRSDYKVCSKAPDSSNRRREAVRTPRFCKYCQFRENKEKCPHLERKGGVLPDNGYCKKFKKRTAGGNP